MEEFEFQLSYELSGILRYHLSWFLNSLFLTLGF